jgi:hypothetical protein
MLLGGLWHGASWNFVLWGLLHGLALALHKAWRTAMGGRAIVPRVIAAPLTFLFVILCWIPFRAPSFGHTTVMLRRMLVLDGAGTHFRPTLLLWSGSLAVIGHLLAIVLRGDFPAPRSATRARVLARIGAVLEVNEISGAHVRLAPRGVLAIYLLTVWLMVIFFFAPTQTSPFIYFQF